MDLMTISERIIISTEKERSFCGVYRTIDLLKAIQSSQLCSHSFMAQTTHVFGGLFFS